MLINNNMGSVGYEQTAAIGESLANGRWKRYCEGLTGTDRSFTAVLLENLRQFISTMDETTRVLQIGNFDKFARV